MSDLNSVCISGNLVRDPELRNTTNGNAVLDFTLAVNKVRRNKETDEKEQITSFVPVSVWGPRTKGLVELLSKGTHVSLVGELRWDAWETSDGQKRSKLSVVARELDIPRAPKVEE